MKYEFNSIIKNRTLFTAVVFCLSIFVLVAVMQSNSYKTKTFGELNSLSNAPVKKVVCPRCGVWGVPHCFYCGNLMHHSQGVNYCYYCQKMGVPFCPNCNIKMQHGQTFTPGAQVPGFSFRQGIPRNAAVLTA